ncbi:molecular chaperone DnaJ [Terriglobus sp. TAA 43]|uniref:molecular chaperone DnaJ n=1 Tax=Terriglobus sp. TAA 43 TaxID=278961 RepID=UPI00068F6158|nr:molecular chaperone DnaJ [Terriglobus sp. TAA 43]
MAGATVKADYYEVLQVTRTATDQEIKTSYRKLAMQFHPDRNPGDKSAEEKFKECSEAYGILSDPQKRAAYDRYGHAGFGGAASQGGGFPGGFSGFGGDPQDLGDIFGDIFGEMFGGGGGGRRQSRAQRGRDLKYDLTMEFEESVFGKEQEIKIKRQETCEGCSGTGSANGKQPVTCSQCRGAGQVRYQQGFFSVARPCPKCEGSGVNVTDPCQTCHGESRVMREHTINVKVPAGVEDGTRIRYQGEGEAGKLGGPAGDLYVELRVKAHKFFQRDGDDLHCVVPVSFPQAALGDELEIETLEGVAVLKVPEGTQSGKSFRIKGKGVPHLNSHGKGDLIVEVRVQTPAKLTKKQKELLKELSETMKTDNAPQSHGFMDRMKEMFS